LTSASILSFFLQTTGTRGRRGHAFFWRRRSRGLAEWQAGGPTDDIKTAPGDRATPALASASAAADDGSAAAAAAAAAKWHPLR